MLRRALLTFLVAAAVFLVPWTGYLAGTLPDHYDTGQWRLAWVGFDIALTACFAAAASLAWRRRRGAVPLLAATSALLCCDAWFDVMLDWAGPDRWTSVAMAVLVEVPMAALLVSHARLLLVGGMPQRALTAQDIEIQHDPAAGRLLDSLRDGPMSTEKLSERDSAAISLLERLEQTGHVRQDRRGHWRTRGQRLRMPAPHEVDPARRPAVAAYLASKYERELRLLSWAAEHRDEFGPWGKGERAVTHLSAAELARFEAEYLDLLTRYCLLRDSPAAGTREIAIRFYAFPVPDPRNLLRP